MNLFGVLGISASALTAQRQRAEVVAANMANAETTRTAAGGPYQRKQVVFAAQSHAGASFSLALERGGQTGGSNGGVRVAQVVSDPAPPIERFDPSHPDADERGYVAFPNINPVTEMVDLMGAVRSYELNAAAVNASKQMIQQSIDLLR